jgi:hypothetical protein
MSSNFWTTTFNRLGLESSEDWLYGPGTSRRKKREETPPPAPAVKVKSKPEPKAATTQATQKAEGEKGKKRKKRGTLLTSPRGILEPAVTRLKTLLGQ